MMLALKNAFLPNILKVSPLNLTISKLKVQNYRWEHKGR